MKNQNIMKKALIVGIDHYSECGENDLKGCINDVNAISELLSTNYHQGNVSAGPNFSCKLLTSTNDPKKKITRHKLKREIKELFEDAEADVALFYFSGHGFENSLGGYLVTQDANEYDEGVAFNDVMIYANNSKIKEIIIILDCCRSGSLGEENLPNLEMASLRKGISILTASTSKQNAIEENGNGVFTRLVCDALSGGNTDILGNVKLTHIYEHVDRMLGPWEQRPTYKSNSARLSPLRKAKPKLQYEILKKMIEYFPGPDYSYSLDASYEPTAERKNPVNEEIFSNLQKMYQNGLVEPKNAEHMYYAAMNSKHCALTDHGKQYWKLLNKGLI